MKLLTLKTNGVGVINYRSPDIFNNEQNSHSKANSKGH